MFLEIIESESLFSDMSVQGIIAFSKGIIQTYNWNEHCYEGYEVMGPSVFIDMDVINDSYINLLLAHEAFHWYKYGKLVIYEVFAEKMHDEGCEFFQSVNGVWLTKKVETKYLNKLR